MQTETIAKKEQAGMISSFWSMLRELETRASSDFQKREVEQFYEQWNRITGDSKKPSFWL